MGLDMYLSGKRYLSKYFDKGDEHRMNAIAELFPELKDRKGRHGDQSPVKEVSIEVGYWRKANAIHNWFVREVQEGEDECNPYTVSRDQLTELRDTCQRILDDRSLAQTLLPPAAGFFFGSTLIDEHYFQELENTIEIINSALAMPPDWDFEYQSSW